MKTQKYIENINSYLYISGLVNIFSLFIIFFMAYKYYKLMKIRKVQTPIPQIQQLPVNTTQGSEGQLNQVVQQTIQNNQNQQNNQNKTQLKNLKTEKIGKENVQYKSNVELQQNPQRVSQNSSSNNEAALRQEIYLQQERSKYLQQKNQSLQSELARLRQKLIKFTTHKSCDYSTAQNQSQQQIINLKNELQFCQKRLNQSNQTQKQLRLKISAYQKFGEHTLNHPQFLRLREMNSNYKTIISKMQSYLIQKHQNSNNMNISFNDL